MRSKVLVIRFSSIGDIVLTSPVLRCLKQQWEGELELHYLTKEAYRPLLEANPHVDKVWTIEKSTSEMVPQLREEEFDYVFDLHKNLRSGQVKSALPALAFTFDKINVAKWLRVNLNVDRLPRVHIVDRYMATLAAFGIANDGEGLEHFIADADVVDGPAIAGSEQYLAVVVGATYATKQLPAEKLIEVLDDYPHPVVLLGGPDDVAIAKTVEQGTNATVVNTCGKYNIQQSASLVQQAARVLSNDTGLMHIAAAFKKLVISVWGNTIPEFGMYPYLPETAAQPEMHEVKGLRCRPCSKLGYKACPKKHFKCMLDLDVPALRKAIQL